MKQFEEPNIQEHTYRLGAWLYVDELMHRTLNDYTELLSLVRLASLSISGDASSNALNDVADRLQASAATFRALSPPRGNSLRSLDLALKDLCDCISNSALAARPVTLHLVSEPISVNAQRCWQISLVVVELVTNAIRHAFKACSNGSILVDLRIRNNIIHCTVRDDGVSRSVISPGRGTNVVDAMVSDLGGSIVRNFSSAGSIVMFLVPAFTATSDMRD